MRGLFSQQAEAQGDLLGARRGTPRRNHWPTRYWQDGAASIPRLSSAAAAFADGVIYLAARGGTVGDLQQQVFDGFYESDWIRKPSAAEIRLALQDERF